MQEKLYTQQRKIEELAKALDLDIRIVTLLFERGYRTAERVKAFLYPNQNMLESPCIANIDEAVERIKISVERQEKIVIFGDYDCDGICSVAMLKMYLEKIGAKVEYFIPAREEGYGLSIQSLERVVEMHLPDLIITVDCGISAYEEVQYCYEVLGVEIIVTDHHEPSEVLPECIVVNPKLDKNSALSALCGAGVVLKLIEAYGGRDIALDYIDLACIATIADVVPLVGENRVIGSLGLKKINTDCRKGLKMLIDSLNLDKVTAADIGYKIAPRLNAPGRMGCKSDIVPLFCSEEFFELEWIIKDINQNNERRQHQTKLVYSKALEKIKELKLEETSVIIIWDSEWDYGILGLVAARLANEFGRPAFVLSSKTEFCRGSARSIKGINIYECLENSKEYLEQFGGHEGAAGFTINTTKLDDFAKHINNYVQEKYANVLDKQAIDYDIKIQTKESVDALFFRQVELFEPTGEGNKAPKFLIDSSLLRFSQIGRTEHTKIRLNKDTEGVLFNSVQVFEGYKAGIEYELKATLNLKKFKNIDYINITADYVSVKSIELAQDTMSSFALYLNTMLYGKGSVSTQFVSVEDALKEKDKGTAFVAFSTESAKEFVANNKGIEIAVGESPKNPKSRLLLFPYQVDYSYYRKVVFLDAPLSTGYIDILQKAAHKTEFLIVKRYGFLDIIANVDITCQGICNTKRVLYNYLNINSNENSPERIYSCITKFDYCIDEYSFATHFAILFDYGIISKTPNGYVVKDYEFEEDKSRVIHTIKKLRD